MNVYKKTHASVAKLVDATDSKSVSRKGVLVQVRPEVPKLKQLLFGSFFLFKIKTISLANEFDNFSIFFMFALVFYLVYFLGEMQIICAYV